MGVETTEVWWTATLTPPLSLEGEGAMGSGRGLSQAPLPEPGPLSGPRYTVLSTVELLVGTLQRHLGNHLAVDAVGGPGEFLVVNVVQHR